MDIPAIANRYRTLACPGIARCLEIMAELDDEGRSDIFRFLLAEGCKVQPLRATEDPLDFLATMIVTQSRKPQFRDEGVDLLDQVCALFAEVWDAAE